jgi:hypothetical protein
MKNLHLLLAIGILVVFGLLICGMMLYLPFWYRIQRSRLLSPDAAVREAAASKVADDGRRAEPYLKEWLDSNDVRMVVGADMVIVILLKNESAAWVKDLEEKAVSRLAAGGKEVIPYVRGLLQSEDDVKVAHGCKVLEEMEGDAWKELLPEIERILDGKPSHKTDAAAELILKKDFIFINVIKETPH